MIQPVHKVVKMSNDLAPKGRYKPAIIASRQSMPMTNSKLSEEYLRSFGFAHTNSSSKSGMCEIQSSIYRVKVERIRGKD